MAGSYMMVRCQPPERSAFVGQVETRANAEFVRV